MSSLEPRPAIDRVSAPSSGYDVSGKAVRQLERRLLTLDAATTTAASVDALVGLTRWLGEGGDGYDRTHADGAVLETARTRRLRLLIASLSSSPSRRASFGQAVARIISGSSGVELFAHVGLPSERGFLGETLDRMTRRLLPAPRDDHDLGAVLARLFPSKADAAWLAAVPTSLVVQIMELAQPVAWHEVRRSARESVTLLGTRVSAIGLSRELYWRARPVDLGDSPFIRLSRVCDTFAETSEVTPAVRLARADACRTEVAACRAVVGTLHESLETTGVSVEVVYQLNVLEKALRRIEQLLDVAVPGEVDSDAGVRLVATLVAAQQRARQVSEILHDNTQLLARKIVERAGQSGEHYVTTDRSGWFAMLRSAAGGGVLTAGTVLVKFLLALLSLPLFLQGLSASLNYAASFVTMQLLHFTLATKQPAMTAAHLAHALVQDEHAGGQRFEVVTELIARITRSQLAAAIGNVTAVIPAVVALDFFWQWMYGRHILSPDAASYTLRSLDPIHTLTLVYAAYTGVLLWVASVVAGWIDNWAVYHRLPEAMEQHRQRKVVGERAMGIVGRFVTRNLSGLAGNISLGFMLGMTGPFGKFFGLPIDVRHVTLSTGSLALAVCTLGPETMLTAEFGLAVAGILSIGLLNFGVSFALALQVAFRARGVGMRERFGLGRALADRWRRARRDFFLPPKKPRGQTAA